MHWRKTYSNCLEEVPQLPAPLYYCGKWARVVQRGYTHLVSDHQHYLEDGGCTYGLAFTYTLFYFKLYCQVIQNFPKEIKIGCIIARICI